MSDADMLLKKYHRANDLLDRIADVLVWPIDEETTQEGIRVFAEVEAKLAVLLADLSGKGLIT